MNEYLSIPKAPVVRLRQWREEDLPFYVEMNADPVVMEYFPKPYTAQETEESFLRQRARIEETGWGLWAVEAQGEFAGFTGLAVPGFDAPFMPCVEIGWRLRRKWWGQGVAFEAARQAEAYAFGTLRLEALCSFTAAVNVRSWKLMERLGFRRVDGGDFLHPKVPPESPLCLHVLYSKTRSDQR
jgi:RimJ/RimL family protein N-acetyltransferase